VVVEHASGTLVAPDVTLTATGADATAMAAGELDPNVTFMQGRMKTAGDPGLLLELLAYVRRVRRAGDREGRASR
jgi:putative sterol carrier protein